MSILNFWKRKAEQRIPFPKAGEGQEMAQAICERVSGAVDKEQVRYQEEKHLAMAAAVPLIGKLRALEKLDGSEFKFSYYPSVSYKGAFYTGRDLGCVVIDTNAESAYGCLIRLLVFPPGDNFLCQTAMLSQTNPRNYELFKDADEALSFITKQALESGVIKTPQKQRQPLVQPV